MSEVQAQKVGDIRSRYESFDAGNCPVRDVLGQLGDKWSTLIIGLLGEKTHRFGELRPYRVCDGAAERRIQAHATRPIPAEPACPVDRMGRNASRRHPAGASGL